MPFRVLVVDDDPHIREVVTFALTQAGFSAAPFAEGEGALASLAREGADLVVLDVGMPGLDGLEVCRRLRKTSDVPILFLSARSEEIDRVVGLELGGDDYVAKPFSPRELVARVQAILKRARPAAPDRAGEAQARIVHDRLSLDPNSFAATYEEAPLALTALEFRILAALAERAGTVLSRAQIMAAAYGPRLHVSDRTIDSHIRNIRAKLAAAGAGALLENVHAVGFRLAVRRP